MMEDQTRKRRAGGGEADKQPLQQLPLVTGILHDSRSLVLGRVSRRL